MNFAPTTECGRWLNGVNPSLRNWPSVAVHSAMPGRPLDESDIMSVYAVYQRYVEEGYRPVGKTGQGVGAVVMTSKEVGISQSGVRRRIKDAEQLRASDSTHEFTAEDVPDDLPPTDDLIARRKAEYARIRSAAEARRLVSVRVNMEGPIGIVHFGDPHVDDPGTDIALLQKHIETVRSTEGLMGANVGDLQNAWIGRLAHLWSQQSTSAKEAWALTEWLVSSVPWLYLLGGNHDVWAGSGSGAGDPVQWMVRNQMGVYEAWGARLGLQFPGRDKPVRINARHDFAGHSQWNPAHGPAKAAQMGWRDHILTCGHKHTSAYQVLKDPSSGLISHAIRVAGYKIYDRYAWEKGLPDQNISPAFTTIIDPQYDDDDPRLITTLFDVFEAAEYLTWKRSR